MRVRMSTKGDVNSHIKNIFDLISSDNYLGAKTEVEGLRGDIAKHFITRNISMDDITYLLNGFQHSLSVGNGNDILKKEVLQEELSEIINLLNSVEQKNTSNKYERLKEIYEDLVDDVQQFNEKERPEDAEAIKVEFREIRDLESQFMSDTTEYAAYKAVVRQMGLCTGSLTNIVNNKLAGASLAKMLKHFEYLYPKIEELIASKLHDKEVKETVKTPLADDQIEQIKDLSDEGNNAEQIAELTGLDASVIEQHIFGDENE
jgi:uncharacterized protein YukE